MTKLTKHKPCSCGLSNGHHKMGCEVRLKKSKKKNGKTNKA